jgi:hypothetical protein
VALAGRGSDTRLSWGGRGLAGARSRTFFGGGGPSPDFGSDRPRRLHLPSIDPLLTVAHSGHIRRMYSAISDDDSDVVSVR